MAAAFRNHMRKTYIVLAGVVFGLAININAQNSNRLPGSLDTVVTLAAALEYEEVLKRSAPELGLDPSDIDDVVDYICSVATHHEIDFLWRPFLRDPDDDMLLELAVQAGCGTIVTHNVRDFAGTESLGVHAVLPRVFLRRIGALP